MGYIRRDIVDIGILWINWIYRTARSEAALASEPAVLKALAFRTARSGGALPSEPPVLKALGSWAV